MLRMVQTELWKLKRYHMIWSAVLLMLLSVLLTVFSTTALDGTVWTFPFFAEQVIKNNATMIFPMCVTLIVGYIIAREEKDDTLKNLLTIPVSYRNILLGKLLAGIFLSLFLGLVSAVFTCVASWMMGFPGLCAKSVIQTFIQITLNCLFLYLAVTPVIAFSARIPNGHMVGTILAFVYGYGGMFAAGDMTLANCYPITASLGLIGYRSYDTAVHWRIALCAGSLVAAVAVAGILIGCARGVKPQRKKSAIPKTAPKKGW